MANIPGANARIYVGGYDLSFFLRNSKISKTRDSSDVTTYKSTLQPAGATAKEFLATLMTGSAQLEGNYAGGLGEVDERLQLALASPAPPTTIAVQDALSSPAYCFLANGSAYDIAPPVEGIVGVTAAFQASQGMERGLISHPLANEVAPGNGGVIDNAAVSLNGLSAYLQMIGFVGADCTVKIQDSANGSTYADLVTFTVITAVNTAERKAVSGTVRQFTRWAISGTFTLVSFQLVLCRK
jgi:hypothetical protein